MAKIIKYGERVIDKLPVSTRTMETDEKPKLVAANKAFEALLRQERPDLENVKPKTVGPNVPRF